MIRVITTRVQARMSCDHPGCSNTIRLPAKLLGWTVEDDYWNSPVTCPNHTPTTTKENQ